MNRPCLGGWCRIRDNCENYNSHSDAPPVERMCMADKDGVLMDYPIRIRRQALTEIPLPLARVVAVWAVSA